LLSVVQFLPFVSRCFGTSIGIGIAMILLPGEDDFFTHVLLVLGKPVEPIADDGLVQRADGSFDHDSATRLTENIVEGLDFQRRFDLVRMPWLERYGHNMTAPWGSHDRYRDWFGERRRAETLG
jgi:hypothetical protein